jgi:hypothetical protein
MYFSNLILLSYVAHFWTIYFPYSYFNFDWQFDRENLSGNYTCSHDK